MPRSWDAPDGTRADDAWVVITVLKTKNNYQIRTTEPKSLEPNQMAIKYKFTTNVKDWFERIQDAGTIKYAPPGKSVLAETPNHGTVGATTTQKVIARLKP